MHSWVQGYIRLICRRDCWVAGIMATGSFHEGVPLGTLLRSDFCLLVERTLVQACPVDCLAALAPPDGVANGYCLMTVWAGTSEAGHELTWARGCVFGLTAFPAVNAVDALRDRLVASLTRILARSLAVWYLTC